MDFKESLANLRKRHAQLTTECEELAQLIEAADKTAEYEDLKSELTKSHNTIKELVAIISDYPKKMQG